MDRSNFYAERLSRMIGVETISASDQTDKSKFYRFHDLLRELFPNLFNVCSFEDHNGSFMLIWKGSSNQDPIMLMNHHDVVEAPGRWKYPPFSGTVAEGKVWGRGTLDTKSGLWAMLQAADELAETGFKPKRDVYFFSACTEETGGKDADAVSKELKEKGVHFYMVLDEGGMILHEPIGGANGTFAMVGLGEKGCAVLKFTARSTGGHASTPGKNTPLVRLGKFMAEVEKSDIFRADLSPAVGEMFSRLSSKMKQPIKFVLKNYKLFKPVLLKILPSISNTAGAMIKTTLAFTMAHGSEGFNVLPQEAWVIGNMRYSHHQGCGKSIEAVKKLAERFNIETEVLDPGYESPVSDYKTDTFKLIESAVSYAYPNVETSPYIMTAASDCRYMSRVSDNCYRFAPFKISHEQMASVHGIDENIDIATLEPAVDFYKYVIEKASAI